MTENPNAKEYDLEERTYLFAKQIRTFGKTLPRTSCNSEDVKQLVRASGSVAANYIEANEALSKKDFKCRIRISRKESKECRLWLRLLDVRGDTALDHERTELIRESTELMKIFGSILQKSK